MPYPTKPQILTSYTAEEQSIGNGTLPGQELDVDLASLRGSMEQVIDFVKLFTRSDGQLANGIVTSEALAASVRIGFDPPEPWATAQAYTTRSTVFEGQQFYLCTVAHTSGVFATDLAAGRWQLLADLSPPAGSLLAANNLSDLADAAAARGNLGVSSTSDVLLKSGNLSGLANTATARTNLGVAIGSDVQPADADLTAIAGLSSNGIVTRTGAGTAAARTVTAGAGISVTNGDGVSGNPTVDFNRGAPVTKTADFTVAASENWLINNKASTACTVTLPAAASFTGREIMIQNNQDLAVNSASSNIIPVRGGSAGAAILPATTGSWAKLVSNGSNWQTVAQSNGINLGVSVASTSGTAVDFTGLPEWIRRVSVHLMGVSTNGANGLLVQIGTSGGFASSGYLGATVEVVGSSGATSTVGFQLGITGIASNVYNGSVVIERATGNTWTARGAIGFSNGGQMFLTAGHVAIGGAIERVRLTSVGGVNTFDAGSVNITWE